MICCLLDHCSVEGSNLLLTLDGSDFCLIDHLAGDLSDLLLHRSLYWRC